MRLNIAVAPVLLREKVMDFLQATAAQWAGWGSQDCTVGGVGGAGEVAITVQSVGEAMA